LRMLNGAHSALAYIGLGAGHVFVHQAIADPAIRPVIERLMREEAAPTIDAAPGQDLTAYAGALLDRFANPAVNRRVILIARDGGSKRSPGTSTVGSVGLRSRLQSLHGSLSCVATIRSTIRLAISYARRLQLPMQRKGCSAKAG
ncbi:MAG: hypothetical protein ACT6RK_08955, partial [Sphingopyxis sp.]